MARLVLAVLCIATAIASSGAVTWTEHGMKMSVRAYDAVCWYEKLKIFPNTDTEGYMKQCSTQAEQVRSQIVQKMSDEKRQKEYFTKWMARPMGGLPSNYNSACGSFLSNADARATKDEGDTLNDHQSQAYPFQAFAYCLMSELRRNHGDAATEAVKNEKTNQKKHWMSTLLDRDNEFRARHGVPPLRLVDELSQAAQYWAQKNADECNMYHSENDDSIRQWRGEGTGESLSAGGGTIDKEDAAYIASDGWYEEIKDYPYPAGYTGDGYDNQFMNIGHFTQSVWKGTKYVGYGYAYNPDCKARGGYSWYIAARYSPGGNMIGSFTDNVLPPRD